MNIKSLRSKIKKYGVSAGLLFGLYLGGCGFPVDKQDDLLLGGSNTPLEEQVFNTGDSEGGKGDGNIHSSESVDINVSSLKDVVLSRKSSSVGDLLRKNIPNYYHPESFKRWVRVMSYVHNGKGICSKDKYEGKKHRWVYIRADGSFVGGVNSQSIGRRGDSIQFGDNETELERLIIRIGEGLEGNDYFVPTKYGRQGYPLEFKCNGDIFRAGLENSLKREIRGQYPPVGGYGEYNVDFYEASWGIFNENGYLDRGILPEGAYIVVDAMALIESHFKFNLDNPSGAMGVLQQKREVLAECGVPRSMYHNALAQIDCAYKYFEKRIDEYAQLDVVRNINFSDSQQKKEFLFFMSVQAYHTGHGNMRNILEFPESVNIINKFIEEGRSPLAMVNAITLRGYGSGEGSVRVGKVSISRLPYLAAAAEELRKFRGGGDGEEGKREGGNRIKGYDLPPSPFLKYRQ